MKTTEITKTKVMKKEKKVKVVPMQEQIDKMVLDYLNASSNHLFHFKSVWGELPTHGKADGMGFRSHHSNQCWQFVLIFNCQSLTELFF